MKTPNLDLYVRKVKSLTDDNYHNEAVLTVVSYLKKKQPYDGDIKRLETIVKGLVAFNDLYGGMPNALIGIRNQLFIKIMELLEPHESEAFRKVF